MNYISDYDDYELNNVPRFFTDLSYVNNLFNTFDFNELNNFLEEIKTWKNTFTYTQEYNHPLINFKQDKYIILTNNLTIYFISPFDLIIESHSRSSGITFSDTIKAINQYENDEEIINNVWTPMKKEIIEQDLINQKNQEIIYKQYLNNNLKKFLKNENNEISSEDAWDSFSDKNNENDFNDIKEDINNFDLNKNDLNERNVKILRSGGIFLIGLYFIKIYFSSFSIDTIFGIFWISLIGYLIYKFR